VAGVDTNRDFSYARQDDKCFMSTTVSSPRYGEGRDENIIELCRIVELSRIE
jgi:hypothetical protein